MVSSTTTTPTAASLAIAASSFASGQAGAILVNTTSANHTVTVLISNFLPGDKYYFYTLMGGPEAVFSRKVAINGNITSAASGGPP